MLLAIDTSTHVSSIALFDAPGVVGEVTWHSHQNHTRSLMPEIVRLLELVGATPADLNAIGVATGPGSFTGLRIGLSAAKGFAYSLNAALIGVPTLDISASAFADQPLPTCAILQVGRGRYGAALYENRDGAAQRVTELAFGTANAIAAHLESVFQRPTNVLVTGELDETLSAALGSSPTHSFIFANAGVRVRRAGVLAALAWQRLAVGKTDDIQTLAPFYIPTASLA